MVNLEKFDDSFDIGINNVKAMSSNNPKADTINLCKSRADKNNKYPATLGVASFVPILDKNMEAIHAVRDILEISVPVPNESYDPNDVNSRPAFWTTFNYIPDYNYKVPLTEEEKKANDALRQAIYEYQDSYGKYDLRPKPLFFMKALLVRIKSDSAGPIYTDYSEPVILRHSSAGFPDAYASAIKDFDDTRGSKEWRRKVFLPDGDINDFIVCTTRPKPNGAIGYNVSCAIIMDAKSGKSCSREKLKEYMDYDIASIGIDTTHFDLHGVKYAIDNIYAALDYMDNMYAEETQPNEESASTSQPVQENLPTSGADIAMAKPNDSVPSSGIEF